MLITRRFMQYYIHLRCGKGTDLIVIVKNNKCLPCIDDCKHHKIYKLINLKILYNDLCISSKMMSIMSNDMSITKLILRLKCPQCTQPCHAL